MDELEKNIMSVVLQKDEEKDKRNGIKVCSKVSYDVRQWDKADEISGRFCVEKKQDIGEMRMLGQMVWRTRRERMQNDTIREMTGVLVSGDTIESIYAYDNDRGDSHCKEDIRSVRKGGPDEGQKRNWRTASAAT